MRPVIQEEATGCGIAAVAAVAGVTYKQARQAAKVLGIVAADQRLWSDTAPVRRLLRRYRIAAAATETPFRSWRALPDLALLALKWHTENRRPCWHWAVFVREQDCAYVVDSKKALTQHVRSDFGRMRPKWFIGLRK